MAEYREQVKHLREWTVLDIQNRPAHTIRMMQTAADTIEKFDAVPVVHGRWLYKRCVVFDFIKDAYRCSECNTTWDAESNYCPNCGARMDGE